MVQAEKLAYRRLTQYKKIQTVLLPSRKAIDKRPVSNGTVGNMKNSQTRGNGKTLRTAGKRGSASHDLTARQRLFALEYPIDFNGKQAAISAGYSPKTAAVKASQLLTKVNVVAEIQKAMDRRNEKVELRAEDTLRALKNQAHHDPRKLFEKGTLKDIEELDLETAQTITGFDFVNLYEDKGEQKHCFGQLRKIRLTDRLKALELLGRHQKLFTDKVEHGLDDESRRFIATKLDFSGVADSDLERVARALETVSQGSGNRPDVPAQPAGVAKKIHKHPR